MTVRVAFRVDASLKIGTGHVMRCLTLANALQTRGADILFICRSHPGHLIDFIETQGYSVRRLDPVPGFVSEPGAGHESWLGDSPDHDAEETVAALSGGDCDWLIVDHYGLDSGWESLLRPHVGHIMVIDDLADRPHNCDLLLDQNFRLGARDRYDALVPPGCRQLLGPQYALLRPEFFAVREALGPRGGKVRRILVSFGGADVQNYTKLALDALDASSAGSLEVDVIAGAVNPHQAELEKRCATRPHTRFFAQVSNIAEMLGKADLAIGAGGTTSWERSALGLPAIVVAVADNQRQIVSDLAEAGLVWGVPHLDAGDVSSFRHILEAAISLTDVNRGMAQRNSDLVDGKGAARAAAALIQSGVSVRPAVAADAHMVFAWRNDPVTRTQLLDAEELSLEAHVAWFATAIRSRDRALLIGELDGEGMGVVRFDIGRDEARVSIYLNPIYRGKGLGPALLGLAIAWLQSHRPDVSALIAEVKCDNNASNALFLDAGFSPYYQRYVKALAP